MGRALAFSFLTLALAACTNAVPQVSQLETPSVAPPVVPEIQTAGYAETTNAGAQSVGTVDGYSAKVLVHSGTSGQTASSSDGYTLEIRHLSF